MAADGSLSKKVVAGVGDVLRADAEYPSEWARCREIFRSPELQMVSFTITEKGYHIKDLAGNYYPAVQAAFEDGSSDKVLGNGMAIIAALLLERFRAGAHPIAMVSMDNFSPQRRQAARLRQDLRGQVGRERLRAEENSSTTSTARRSPSRGR